MTLEARLRQAIDGKAKPHGALGRLEDLAVALGQIQGTLRPAVVNPVALVFAADHGAASRVSAYPSAVTAAMVRAYRNGQGAINLFARQAGARLVVVDAGVDAVFETDADAASANPAFIGAKIAPGTQDWTTGPAMSLAQARQALAAPAAIVDRLATEGTTVVALGEMGIGNTASAALLVHKIAGLPLQVGRGAGLDDAGLARKRALAEAAAARTPARMDPLDALAEYGGFEIAMLAGAILQAADRRVCIVVDGLIVTAAALLAHAIRPNALQTCIFAHRSPEPGHAAMLDRLAATPLLDLGMRLGEGTGAVLAIPLLRAAASILTGMADLADLA